MNKIIVTKIFLGICHMQVCAEADATDEEILEVCNKENPAGTINGWTSVIRNIGDTFEGKNEKALPVQCEDRPDRKHFLVAC